MYTLHCSDIFFVEDSYERGEVGQGGCKDFDNDTDFTDLNNLYNVVIRMFCFNSYDDFTLVLNTDCNELIVDYMEDSDGNVVCKADTETWEQWKKGEIKLFSCSAYCKVLERHVLKLEDSLSRDFFDDII